MTSTPFSRGPEDTENGCHSVKERAGKLTKQYCPTRDKNDQMSEETTNKRAEAEGLEEESII